MNKTAARIIARIKAQGGSYGPNANIAGYLEPGELGALRLAVERVAADLLDALVIDRSDPNAAETPRRLASMFLEEVFAGRYLEAPRIAEFPNGKQLDQAFVVGPIAVRSACSHHLVPIIGQAWVGIVPGEKVIGLSKYHRIAGWIMGRPQIQEEATVQLADEIEALARPLGLAVIVRAKHFCCAWRGVRDGGSVMTTSVMRGVFRDEGPARAELMELLKGSGF